jgi:uncharacterized protein (DUF488 family)
MNDVEIYTIGHSNLSGEALVNLLRQHRIQVVVDVRSMPYSQYAPQFNREALARTLSRAGIEYKYEGKRLGGRPEDPTCYKSGEVPASNKADYLRLVDYDEVAQRDWYKAGISDLLATAKERRTAILCSEEDPNRCHRHHLIAQTLLDIGVTVWHIRGSGALETPQGRQLRLMMFCRPCASA